MTTSSAPMAEVKILSNACYGGNDNRAQCKDEIMAFLRGGAVGAERLKEILPSLFSYYKIVTMEGKARLLMDCQLHPYMSDINDEVTFFFKKYDTPDHFKPPRYAMKGANAWIAWIKPDDIMDQEPSATVGAGV